jgi:Family of unknown function (DUF6580)
MLAYLFVLFAIAIRFVPHPWSFTPVAAALLFFGARGQRRMMWLPVALLVISDLALYKYVWELPMHWDQYLTWVWYGAIVWLGTALQKNQKPLRLIGAALASSVSFFVVSNFAVWAASNLYPKNFGGLLMSYAAGLPFFRHTVESDLLFTGIMFSIGALAPTFSRAFDRNPDHPAAA